MTWFITVIAQKLSSIILIGWLLLSTRLVPVIVPSLILIVSRIVVVATGQIVAIMILK